VINPYESPVIPVEEQSEYYALPAPLIAMMICVVGAVIGFGIYAGGFICAEWQGKSQTCSSLQLWGIVIELGCGVLLVAIDKLTEKSK